MINENRHIIIMDILETALAINGATLTRLMNKLEITESPDNLKMYLSILENRGLLSYQKADGIYRTTYKGKQFLRTYKNVINLLSNPKKET
jgi:predicted transcriptional regulator